MSARTDNRIYRFDERAIGFVRQYGILVLRVAVAVVFIWFGALKVFGVSPVADLVARMLPFLPPDVAVKGMGVLELLIGAGLLSGWAIRVTMLVFFLQMLGTFLVLVLEPDQSFLHGNPLLLTVLGEFIVKNLVLIAAGIVIASAITPARPRERVAQMLTERLD
jgi:putative oxidoreductase